MESGSLIRFPLRSTFGSTAFGVGVNLCAVGGFAAKHLFAGYRQNGVHCFGERREFCGMFHKPILHTGWIIEVPDFDNKRYQL